MIRIQIPSEIIEVSQIGAGILINNKHSDLDSVKIIKLNLIKFFAYYK